MKNRTHHYYVYIITNKRNTVLYIGVTNDLQKRIWEHKNINCDSSFASRYNVEKLVYFEESSDIEDAIAREKEIKGWIRKKKIALIEAMNPSWKDIADSLTCSQRDSSESNCTRPASE